MPLGIMPVVDYERHPAFEGMRAGNDTEAEALVAKIDAAYAQLVAKAPDGLSLEAAFDRDIAPKFDGLTDRLVATSRPRFHPYLKQAMDIARNMLRDDLGARNEAAMKSNSVMEKLKGHFASGLSFFRQTGYYKFDQPSLARFTWIATTVERAVLRLKSKQIPAPHCVLSLHAHSPATLMLKRVLQKSGAIDLASAYLGKPAEFFYAALDHAHPAQSWYQDCYNDTQLGTAKTVYMHTDANCDIIKAMMYLQDVDEEDGPFCFVPGSSQWERSPLVVAVQKGFDEASGYVFAGRPDNGNYYRPRFRHAEERRDMLALPPSLRGSTHFGDDVLDGSELSDALLSAEKRFVAPAGTVVMFDGSRGIHRGGLVQPGGSRWAIQLAFRVRRGPPPSRWRSLGKAAYGLLSYCKYIVTRTAGLARGRYLP
jgi:ectoine hydroxylase-related dioxygenase (phytanoyl-CoA dioxygenase family)